MDALPNEVWPALGVGALPDEAWLAPVWKLLLNEGLVCGIKALPD